MSKRVSEKDSNNLKKKNWNCQKSILNPEILQLKSKTIVLYSPYKPIVQSNITVIGKEKSKMHN